MKKKFELDHEETIALIAKGLAKSVDEFLEPLKRVNKDNIVYLRLSNSDLKFVDELMKKYDIPTRSALLRYLIQNQVRQIKEGK